MVHHPQVSSPAQMIETSFKLQDAERKGGTGFEMIETSSVFTANSLSPPFSPENKRTLRRNALFF